MNIFIKDGEDAHPRIGAQLATSPWEIEPVSKMYENNKITGAITQLCVIVFYCPSYAQVVEWQEKCCFILLFGR